MNIKQEKGNVTVTVDNPDISKGNRNDTIIVTLKDKQYERISVEDKLGDIQLKNLSAKHITIEEKLGILRWNISFPKIWRLRNLPEILRWMDSFMETV